MAWPGEADYRADVMKLVRMGQTWVPRKVSMHFRGQDGTPEIRATFEVRAGAPECVELRVVADPKGRGLRNVDLDSLNIDGMTTRAFLKFARHRNVGTRSDAGAFRGARRDLEPVRSGRPKITRKELEEVARIYKKYEGNGNPTSSVAKVMELTPRTAARRVQRAREDGLLPPAAEGTNRG